MDNTTQQKLPNGSRIGVYEIRGAAVSNDFSIVYRGWNHHLNAKVCIEEYFPQQFAQRTASAETLEPISNESQNNFDVGLSSFIERSEILLDIDHPNIITFMNVLELNGTAYLVSDFTDELSLAKLCINRHTQFDEDQLRVIFLPILDALKQVHKHAIIHGAVTPENILLNKEAEPILVYFASARLALALQTDTLSEFISADYAPPEYGGTSGELGPWTDIYTLGASMYQCVCSRPPIPARDRIAALSRNAPDPFQPLAQMPNVAYSKLLCATIDSMLALQTADRPQSADAVLKLLEQATKNNSVDTTRTLNDNSWFPTTDQVKYKYTIAGTSVVLLSVVIIAVGYWFHKPLGSGVDSLATGDLSQVDAAEVLVETAPKLKSSGTSEQLALAKAKKHNDDLSAKNIQNASHGVTGAASTPDSSYLNNEQKPTRAKSDVSGPATLAKNQTTLGTVPQDKLTDPDLIAASAEFSEIPLPNEIDREKRNSRKNKSNQQEPILTQLGRQKHTNGTLDSKKERSAAVIFEASTTDKKRGASSTVFETAEPSPAKVVNSAEPITPSPVSMKLAGTQTTGGSSGMSDADQERIIAEHLAAAEEHLNAERLTTPAEGNAYAHYRAILEIAPNHPHGRMGLERILSHYGILIEKAVSQGRLQHAWIYLSRARNTLPGAPALEDFMAMIEDAEVVNDGDLKKR